MSGELRAKTTVATRESRLSAEDARQLALELKAALEGPRFTFGELAASWLSSVGSRRVRPQNERRHVEHLAGVAHLAEGELTVTALQAQFAALGDRLSNETLNKVRSTGRLVVAAAQADGRWRGHNPFQVMRRLRERRRAYATMTPEEAARVLACVRSDRRALTRVALFLGPRPGELLGLQKSDVDLERRSILIHRSHQRDSTKTGRERRVPIPEAVVEDLRAAMEASPSALVFPKPSGEPMRADTKLTRMLHAALVMAGVVTGYRHKCRRCGAEEERAEGLQRWCECGAKMWASGIARHLRFYDLRHMMASLHRQAGADPLAIKLVLGHASRDATDDIYTHLTEEYVRRELNRLVLPAPGRTPPSGGGDGDGNKGVALALSTGVQREVMRDAPANGVASAGGGSSVGRARASQASARWCDPDSLLTVREAAARLRVCAATLYRMVNTGSLPAIRIGSLIRVRAADLPVAGLTVVRATAQHDEVPHVPDASSRSPTRR